MFLFFVLLLITIFSPATSFAATYDLIPPVTVGDSERLPPRGDPKNEEDKTAKYYSNDASTGYACTYNIPISNIFLPKFIQPTAAPSATPAPPIPDPYDVNRIEQDYTSNNLTNFVYRTSSSHLAKDPPINPLATDADRIISQNSYRQDGRNMTIRSVPNQIQYYLKGQLIEEIARSLDNANVIATDEQLGWACQGHFQILFPKPSGCRPVTISEVGYYYLQAGDSTSYRLLDYSQTEKVAFPSDVSAALTSHYAGSGYLQRFGVSFSLMSPADYELLYRDLPLVPRGSVNNLLQIRHQDDTTTGGVVVTDTINKTVPLAAALSSSQANYTLNLIKPAKQTTVSDTDTVCTNTADNPAILDKPSPVSFIAWLAKFFGTVTDKEEKYEGINKIVKIFPNETLNNINADETFLSGLVPQADHDKYNFTGINKSSTGGISNANDPEPGLRDSQLREYNYLLTSPDSWRKDPAF